MGRKRFLSSVLLAALLCGPVAMAQNSNDANSLFRPAVPNPPSLFKFTVDTTGLPNLALPPMLSYPNGQVHQFGGILQPFANFVNRGILDSAKLPFGGTVALPVGKSRVEVVGSTAGIYTPFQTRYGPHDSWLMQTSIGARVALDPEHRAWVGVGEYFLTNFADHTRHWSYKGADLTFRWGR